MSNLEVKPDLSNLVERELRNLCITGKYHGLSYLVSAIQQVVITPAKVKKLTTELYPEIASEFYTSPSGVEHAIRTAIQACWDRGGRKTLDKMIGRHLIERPTNCEFMDQISSYIRRRY